MANRSGVNSEADFNPIGEKLANSFMQNRNQATSDSRFEYERFSHSNIHSEKSSRSSSALSNAASPGSDRGDRDQWAGGENLSTNKLSLMLSDMQGRLKDLPTPDTSEEGPFWVGRTPSTDSLDVSEMGSVLFGNLRSDASYSPSIYNNSESGSPSPNLEHKRLRPAKRSNSEDDNDSLSSVSTASTSSFQRSRRQSRLTAPTSRLQAGSSADASSSRYAALGRKNTSRYPDHDTDYISDGASVTSSESAARSHKSAHSQAWKSANNALTKLQLQQQQLQQMQPMFQAPAPASQQAAPAAPSSAQHTQSKPISTSISLDIEPRDSNLPKKAAEAKGGSGRTSPPRARPSADASTEPASASKPRSTTPTGIPRAMAAASTPARKVAEETQPAAVAVPARVEPAVQSASASASSARNRASSVERGAIVSVLNTIEPKGRSASVERGTSGTRPTASTNARAPTTSPATPAASRGKAPATGVEKTSPPQSGARKVEPSEDAYPERGRMRIRSASNPRTSAVERFGPPSSLGRSASVDLDSAGRRSEAAAAPVMQRSHSLVRSQNMTRSDPSTAVSRPNPATSAVQNRRSDPSAAELRSPPATKTNSRATNAVTPDAAATKKSRMSTGGLASAQNNGFVRSPVVPSSTRSPIVKTPSAAQRRLSDMSSSSAAAVKKDSVTPKRTANGTQSRTSLGGSRTPTTTPQQAGKTKAQQTPSRVNTNVVSVPTPRGLTPNRTSSSSLSTQGSASATGGSRSSTPTSLGGSRSNSSQRSRTPPSVGLRGRGASTLTPVQLKSQNPFPLRSSLSPRHSLESANAFREYSPNAPAKLGSTPPSRDVRAVRSSPAAASNGTPKSRVGSSLSARSPQGQMPEVSSPSMGESDLESLSSPVSTMHTKTHKQLQLPPGAVQYSPSARSVPLMMSMAHLSQESITGVYESANYNPSPMHFPRSPKSIAKYAMRGSDGSDKTRLSIERVDRSDFRVDRPEVYPEAAKDDTDQGSGNTETTKASQSSGDSLDIDAGYALHGSQSPKYPTGKVSE